MPLADPVANPRQTQQPFTPTFGAKSHSSQRGEDSGPIWFKLVCKGPQEHINPARLPSPYRDVLFMQSRPGFMRRWARLREGASSSDRPHTQRCGCVPADFLLWARRAFGNRQGSSWLLPAGHLLVQGSSEGLTRTFSVQEQGHRRRSKIPGVRPQAFLG